MKSFLLSCCFFLSAASISGQDISSTSLGLKVPPHNNCTAVKDQSSSSTCWSFSSMSLIESDLLKSGTGTNDLSEMFVARHSYVRKIEKHLACGGKNFFTPGGQFHDVVWVMKHYGMMPESAYSGRNGTVLPHNHNLLDTAISQLVKELLTSHVKTLNAEHYRIIDSILDHHLGKEPASFDYKGRSYTAVSFLQQYLKIDPDDYVEITSYTHHPFYTSFIFESKYNWTSDYYYNVPMKDFLGITNNALKKGYTVGWDGDVEEPGFDFGNNLAYLPAPVTDLQQERQSTFEDSSSSIDHMMHIVAVTNDKYGKPWYFVKNSWGDAYNPLKGFLFMSRDYFAVKTGAIIVNKKAIDPALRKKMGISK